MNSHNLRTRIISLLLVLCLTAGILPAVSGMNAYSGQDLPGEITEPIGDEDPASGLEDPEEGEPGNPEEPDDPEGIITGDPENNGPEDDDPGLNDDDTDDADDAGGSGEDGSVPEDSIPGDDDDSNVPDTDDDPAGSDSVIDNSGSMNSDALLPEEDAKVYELDPQWQGAPIAEDRVVIKLESNPGVFSMPDLGVDIADMQLLNPGSDVSNINSFALMSNDDKYNTIYLLTLANTGESAVAEALSILNANPAIKYAEPDFQYAAATLIDYADIPADISDTYNNTAAVPNDTMYTYQWHHSAVFSETAWNNTTGSKNIVVGILDTGIQGTHPDLKDNLWVNPNPNQYGYKNDTNGYNFYSRTGGTPTDFDGHGTHVAGLVGARGNNRAGVTGMNWRVSLAWLGVPGFWNSDIMAAINYANLHNIPIINASYGGHTYSGIMEDVIRNYNGLFIACAGNGRLINTSTGLRWDGVGYNLTTGPRLYPANYNSSNIIAVAATTSSHSRTGFSNFGSSVHIAAPGQGILSTYIGSSYSYMDGTSMATPIVAGIAALVKAKNPNYTAADIKSVLLSTVRPVTALNGVVSSGGIVNAFAATNAGAIANRHPQPNVKINYRTERLTGLAAGASYTVNGLTRTANSSGQIPIESSWYDTTIRVIRRASGSRAASDARVVQIAARPAAPSASFSIIRSTAGHSNGSILGTKNTMEYKRSTSSTWISVSGSQITGLSAGTYNIRLKGTSERFPSVSRNVTISNFTPRTGWQQISGYWYYYRANGSMVTGWMQSGSAWYYFQPTGRMAAGTWLTINGSRYYFRSGGEMATGWINLSGKWYYIRPNGAAIVNGWLSWNGSWYYFNSSGAMVTGSRTIKNVSYFFNSSGAMHTGWRQSGGKWYFYKSSGAMAKSEWLSWGGKWYYFNSSGVMVTGWRTVNNVRYFFLSSGAMATGWQKIGSDWYFFRSNGSMATNAWLQSGSNWYYMKSNGKMAANETLRINGVRYRFAASGAWIP